MYTLIYFGTDEKVNTDTDMKKILKIKDLEKSKLNSLL